MTKYYKALIPLLTQLRKHRSWVLLFAIIGILFMLYTFNPTHYVLMPKCPFKLITGWSCPGCGIQRCIHALLHGRWAEALHYNYFLIYSLPYFICILITEFGTKGKYHQRCLQFFEGRKAITLYITLFCAWGIVRNVYGL